MRMAAHVVAVRVRVPGDLEHVLAGDVDGHAVEAGLHDAARPARLVGQLHLLVAVGGRCGTEQEGRAELPPEEVRLQGHGLQHATRQGGAALGGLVHHRRGPVQQEGLHREGDVLAGGGGLHHGGGTVGQVARVEDAFDLFPGHGAPGADGDDHDVARQRAGPRGGLVHHVARVEGLSLGQDHARGLETLHASTFCEDLGAPGAARDGDALVQEFGPLRPGKRHLVQGLQAEHLHYRAAPAGLGRAVHGDGAAADDGHPLALEVTGPGQEGDPVQGLVLARDAQLVRRVQARGHHHGREALPEERRRRCHGAVEVDPGARLGLEPRDVGAEHLLVEPVVRDQVAHAAGLAVALEDLGREALLGQQGRRRETGGAATDHGHLAAIGLGPVEGGHHTQVLRLLDDGGLHRRDVDGMVEGAVGAGLHAVVVRTHRAADAAQGVVAQDQRGGPLEVRGEPDPGGGDEVRGGAVRGTGFTAGLLGAVLAAAELRLQLRVG